MVNITLEGAQIPAGQITFTIVGLVVVLIIGGVAWLVRGSIPTISKVPTEDKEKGTEERPKSFWSKGIWR